jgi:hypothetical protein
MVNHAVQHPNGSASHQAWAQDRTLHVAVAYSNPYRWKARQALFNDFRRHMSALPNVKLYVGELAYGERPFEVTSETTPLDFQWRTREVLWHKENLLNRVIERFDAGWQYGAYVDGDMNFNRYDIALETIQQLQLHEWAQMFSALTDLDFEHRPLRTFRSFASAYQDNGCVAVVREDCHKPGARRGVGATGGAWAFRRAAFDAVGGLLDTCILGSGDWHMSYGLIQEDVAHPEITECGAKYVESIQIWQKRAAALRRNIGCVPCHATHYWHGSRKRRGYGDRWQILRDHDFDPLRDIYRDSNGIYQLSPERIKLRDEIRAYFRSRNEDDIQFMESDKLAAH